MIEHSTVTALSSYCFSTQFLLEISRKFSFVRQKPVVRNTTVFNNIAFGPKVRGMKYDEYQQGVNEIIEFIGLKGMESESASSLSGGEIQRVAIAMNFVINPEIYLLDEVSANLDQTNVKLLGPGP